MVRDERVRKNSCMSNSRRSRLPGLHFNRCAFGALAALAILLPQSHGDDLSGGPAEVTTPAVDLSMEATESQPSPAANAGDALVTSAELPPSPPDVSADAPLPADAASATEHVTLLTNPEAVEAVTFDESSGRSPWRFSFYSGVNVRATDNLFIQSQDQQSDVAFVLGAGLAVARGALAEEVLNGFGTTLPTDDPQPGEEGSYVFAYYLPRASLFAEHSSENSLDHEALALARWTGAKLGISFRARFQTLSGADVDVGNRADRSIFNARIRATYALTGKTTLATEVENVTTEYSGNGFSSSEWINRSWLNFQLTPKLQLGAGLAVGYLAVEGSADQVFEQALLRADYRPGEKLRLSVTGGVEFRQTDGSEENPTPVFGSEVEYRPRETTSFRLEGRRQTFSSAGFAGENYHFTSVTASAVQLLAQRFALGFAGGCQNSNYVSTGGGGGTGREDNLWFIRPSLGFRFTERARLELSYQHRTNDSSLEFLSFSENVASLQIDVLF